MGVSGQHHAAAGLLPENNRYPGPVWRGAGNLFPNGIRSHDRPARSEIIIVIIINFNWVVTRWQWLFYMYTKYEIGY